MKVVTLGSVNSVAARQAAYKTANILAVVTIIYNVLEALVSVWFGYEDGTLALFGFGVDSLVEVVSGVGVWHMVRRIQTSPDDSPDKFEQRALRITGTSFYLLFVGLTTSAAISLIQHHRPDTTLWGILVAAVSIASMLVLVNLKTNVGRKLNSQAILADAACTRVCLNLSVVLLLASVGYEMTGIGSLDGIGTLFIAWFSFKEGREAFQKAKGLACSCGGKCMLKESL